MFIWNYLCQTSQKKLKFLYVVVPELKLTNPKFKVSKKFFRGNTANLSLGSRKIKSDYDVFQQLKNGISNMTGGLKIAGPVQLFV